MKRRTLTANRVIWAVLLVAVFAGAWFTGERVLYLSAAVLIVMPPASLAATYYFLRRLKVSRTQPDVVTKNLPAMLRVDLHNATFMPLGNIEVLINADKHAIEVIENPTVQLNPYGKARLDISFRAEFRGHFLFGLRAVQITDITGLFKLSRGFDAARTITSLPSVSDMRSFPMSMNLMTQASSRFDIRDEDYSTISDIRQYLPTDSIKRVHWKLTAKRNEWLVKNFQSNALNLVSIILDTARLELPMRDTYALEDRMVEDAVSLAKFCLHRGMPVEFSTTEGRKSSGKNPGEFDIVYQAAGALVFEKTPPQDCHAILAHTLNEASGYVNAVIFTTRLTANLYEKILNSTNNGHYIAVMYFSTPNASEETREIFKLLNEGATPCYPIDVFAA